ncbi:hypothetical protein N7470_008330 [Penicillium chermesinum]|nr:hypothetical protein N7470_008330 [Penicillium chermesinum]
MTSATRYAVTAYGVFSVFVYGFLAIVKGTFFQKRTERQLVELQIASDRLWNLSKDFAGLSHHILTLASGFKFHLVSNEVPGSTEAQNSTKPLVIFIHGFPDSWAVWRNVINQPELQKSATIVALDMPGYGGSEGLPKYDGTNVLEKMTELIITLRSKYGVDDETTKNKKKTIILAHDWGCVVAMRLAAEAPTVADRFVLSNGPLPALALSNIKRLLSTAQKKFQEARAAPLRAYSPLREAWQALRPVLRQGVLSGYIFAMQLPVPWVKYFLTGGNASLMRDVHTGSYGKAKFTMRDIAESMASTLGPSLSESKTETPNGETYPTSINFNGEERPNPDGTSPPEIEAWLSEHGATGLDEGLPGSFKAPATVFWGEKDIALEKAICLDGIIDFTSANSQVVLLPESGHFTPVELESRAAFLRTVQWFIDGEQGDVGTAIQEVYPSARVLAQK